MKFAKDYKIAELMHTLPEGIEAEFFVFREEISALSKAGVCGVITARQAQENALKEQFGIKWFL